MIHIIAPVHIRAAQYAAALGLSEGQWRPTIPTSVAAQVHLLPGLDPEAAASARAAASRTNGRLVDHT